ncbi:MAG: putative Holliday junction resolvase [Pirellulaceae bacterium]|jgi:putative Holliday junction resolvase
MSSDFPEQGRLAGIDFGTVRIGISVCDADRILASPHENYSRQSIEDDAEHFKQFVLEESIIGFVVGLPVHSSGDESEKSWEARDFAKWLTATTSLPIAFYDERYTSAQAEQFLSAAKVSKKQKKQRRDMLAAQIILAAYLDSPQRADYDPGALD